jgi:hypothetical protein
LENGAGSFGCSFISKRNSDPVKKQSTRTKLASILLMVGILTLVQSSFTRKEAENMARSRVMFNNMPLTTSTMLLDARGVLTMVEGDQANVHAKKIPFRAYVKRGDAIISQASSETSKTIHEVEVGKLLMGAKKGDELIIEPVAKNSEQVRRVVKLAGYTQFHWFPIPRDPGNGC